MLGLLVTVLLSLSLLTTTPTTANAAPLSNQKSTRAPSAAAKQLAKRGGFDLPLTVTRRVGGSPLKRDGVVSGDVGLGDNADLLYTVPIEMGDITTAVHLDTGSSDLWVITDQCTTGTCIGATATRYPSKLVNSSGVSVTMQYGDSTTGTQASGPVAFDVAALAGVAINTQPFSAATSTTNPTVTYGAAGILGLGFPSGSIIQEQLVTTNFGPITETDDFLRATAQYGPTMSRMSMTGALAEPRVTIALQRDTIDVSGTQGTLSVGKLPDGLTDDDFTWVPVRLYKPADGGLKAPSFAPNEVYPFRWEIDIDAVILDGKQLPASTIPATGGVDASKVSALIDTGNSLIRGPRDVITSILSSVSGNAANTLPCNVPHTLSFQIGGKVFPIDPRDFISQNKAGNAQTCVASNVVATDPPGFGALFQWSLGDPFFKSNIVTFHYGNLTNPSQDPPMVGIKSIVPNNAAQLLQQAVQQAQGNGGNFESTLELAPTASVAAEGEITISQGSNQAPSTTAAAPTVTTTTSSSNSNGNGNSNSNGSNGGSQNGQGNGGPKSPNNGGNKSDRPPRVTRTTQPPQLTTLPPTFSVPSPATTQTQTPDNTPAAEPVGETTTTTPAASPTVVIPNNPTTPPAAALSSMMGMGNVPAGPVVVMSSLSPSSSSSSSSVSTTPAVSAAGATSSSSASTSASATDAGDDANANAGNNPGVGSAPASGAQPTDGSGNKSQATAGGARARGVPMSFGSVVVAVVLAGFVGVW